MATVTQGPSYGTHGQMENDHTLQQEKDQVTIKVAERFANLKRCEEACNIKTKSLAPGACISACHVKYIIEPLQQSHKSLQSDIKQFILVFAGVIISATIIYAAGIIFLVRKRSIEYETSFTKLQALCKKQTDCIKELYAKMPSAVPHESTI